MKKLIAWFRGPIFYDQEDQPNGIWKPTLRERWDFEMFGGLKGEDPYTYWWRFHHTGMPEFSIRLQYFMRSWHFEIHIWKWYVWVQW